MPLIALAGNPNVGKSTLFNALTGQHQHTGNWSGKTVAQARGGFSYKGCAYQLVDLPGTYGFDGGSQEERLAADFLRSGAADCTVAVCDATCLARSLALVLRVIALCPRCVVCVNLVDEAERAGTQVDIALLRARLGVPVVATAAEYRQGLGKLCEELRSVCDGFTPLPAPQQALSQAAALEQAQALAHECLRSERAASTQQTLSARLDRLFLHPQLGYVFLFLLLLLVFWLTIAAANVPSQGLQWCFDRLGTGLERLFAWLSLPPWLHGALLGGIYQTTARVVAVMLPPMAIFFPLFSLLEELGYLPRVAFLLDERFRRVGACGKQALTLCMGFGCNAAGVTGCRIIDSRRERLIAILTNAFVPCNGRFPALIFLLTLSFSFGSALLGALGLTACIVFSVAMTLLASRLLHKTLVRGEESSFVLELPPYRRPRLGPLLLRALVERTARILGRAVMVAAPAGLLIWLLGQLRVQEMPLLSYLARLLDAPAALLGLNGAILLAFLLGSPANELVFPILTMLLCTGTSLAGGSDAAMSGVLLANGWSWRLSLCTMVFVLFHWPCTTTVLTIYRETRSRKWTLLAIALPTAFGVVLCAGLNAVLHLLF